MSIDGWRNIPIALIERFRKVWKNCPRKWKSKPTHASFAAASIPTSTVTTGLLPKLLLPPAPIRSDA
jgi:hypothetical protein